MWKFWKRWGGSGGGAGGSRTSSLQGSTVDLRDKFYLETHGTHGFPLGPSCMTYDPYRHVLFFGTNSGELKMYGRPGVELAALHPNFNKVLQILPFAQEHSIITVCNNNMLHKWGLCDSDGNSQLSLKRTYKFQGGLAKTITVCCLPPYCDCLFVGTLGGITYPIDTEFDGMSPEVLSWSRARAYLGYRGKDVPGEVRCLQINPAMPKQLLIGYEHNYLEIWDSMTWKPLSIYGPMKDCDDLCAVCWHAEGKQFATTHKDGLVCVWTADEPQSAPVIRKFYENQGRLQEINRMLWPDDEFMVFSGGAPYDLVDGDSVTLWDGKEMTALQLTSPVKGMHILEDSQTDMDSGIVGATETDVMTTARRILILLLEQEILFIELTLPELPLLQLPYLNSLHNSPVKEVCIHSSVDKDVWSIISRVGKVQQENIFRASCKVWPIDGGSFDSSLKEKHDLLISGHEDGSVKFWDIREISMKLLYEVKCLQYFNTLASDFHSDIDDDEEEESGRPRCRQIGFWDPRSDDDQLIVTSIKFLGEDLLVGFQGGNALLLSINNQSADCTIEMRKVSIMRDDPRQRGRTWQAPLDVRQDPIECAPGYQPKFCVNLFPSVSVTALGIAKEQGLLGVGCIYGFAVLDYFKKEPLYVHCTYDQELGEASSLSRTQSIRRSFRQSLRRLNIRQSLRNSQSVNRPYHPQPLQRSGSMRSSFLNRVSSIRRSTANSTAVKGSRAGGGAVAAQPSPEKVVPPRRDSIRTIDFTAPTHMTGSSQTHGLLVGTNQGAVLGYMIEVPKPKDRNTRSPVVVQIEKDLHQRKNQAVLFAGTIDGQGYLLDANDSGSYKPKGNHYVIICTEDLLRCFSVPGMKKKYRVKFSRPHDEEEYHVVSAHYLRVSGQSVILLMDSEGNVMVYSLPELNLLYKDNCVDAADAVGQRHFVCSRNGLILHQKSPAEFTRGSITDEARLEYQISLEVREPTPAGVFRRFSRPASEGPHLVELGQEETIEVNVNIDSMEPASPQPPAQKTASPQPPAQKTASPQPPTQKTSSPPPDMPNTERPPSTLEDQLPPLTPVMENQTSLPNADSPDSPDRRATGEFRRSVATRRSRRSADRKSVELPDHYYHAPPSVSRRQFQERAL